MEEDEVEGDCGPEKWSHRILSDFVLHDATKGTCAKCFADLSQECAMDQLTVEAATILTLAASSLILHVETVGFRDL
jgi:hypothetical protein